MTSNLTRSQPFASGFVPLSLAPGFSRVLAGWPRENRFNGFPLHGRQTAEAVADHQGANTRLNPGANETAAWKSKKRLNYAA